MYRKIDKKRTIQIVVDRYWGKELKKLAAEQGMSIKAYTEQILADYIGVIGEVAKSDILLKANRVHPH